MCIRDRDTIKGKGIKCFEGKASCHNANINAELMEECLVDLDEIEKSLK